jgi:DNA-binding beta-propeller fold protein YncE
MANPSGSVCCVPAPPVIAFDPAGNIIQAWGGPGQGYDWPSTEHGIHVDHKGNVWVGGSATRGNDKRPADGMVLKFTRDGKFLMQIGRPGEPPKKSLDETQVWGAADMAVDPATNEVLVADGYGNHRVVVFDADTGKFKRSWGAYGKAPTDNDIGRYKPGEPRATQFRNVHCIELGRDGLVYVCDRDNNRMQVFKKDGSFVSEYVYRPETHDGAGTVGNISFSPDNTLIALADIGNYIVRLVRRDKPDVVVHEFGTYGNYAGQLNRMHQAAFDSKGNIFAAEAAGRRVQKFVRQ